MLGGMVCCAFVDGGLRRIENLSLVEWVAQWPWLWQHETLPMACYGICSLRCVGALCCVTAGEVEKLRS